MQEDHITLARIGRHAMRLATLAYATYLFLGALVFIAWFIYLQLWVGLAEGLFLLVCAAVFSWGQRRAPEPPKSSGRGTRTRTARGRRLAWSLRRWSLITTGAGAGIAVAMVPFFMIARHYNMGAVMLPTMLFVFGLVLAATGVIIFFVDVIDSRGERSPKTL